MNLNSPGLKKADKLRKKQKYVLYYDTYRVAAQQHVEKYLPAISGKGEK
jgi:hypothetical protein